MKAILGILKSQFGKLRSLLSYQKTALRGTRKPLSKKEWWLEQTLSFGVALFAVLVVRSSFLEAFKIPSTSMLPGLLVGDHLFVNKLSYGLRVPFSDWLMREPLYLAKWATPQRGQVIVFLYPGNEDLYYIKRVIGLPGDTVEIREDRVYLNGDLVHRQRVAPEREREIFLTLKDDLRYESAHYEVFEEHLGAHPHLILQLRSHRTERFAGPFHVPPRSYFVMGDNRNGSLDSRSWGFLEERAIKGQAVLVWASFVFDLFEGQFGFKPTRTGVWIR